MDQQTGHDAPASAHTATAHNGIPVIRVAGVLDTESNQHVANEFRALADTRPVAIVMDLRDVSFMGSTGIAMLINAQHQANRLHVPFAIVADNHSVLRPLQVSQVHSTLALCPTVDEAVAAVRLAST
ncbi:anti-anti-sigma factor [Lentzea xinjiangensis]|uniref:Anti-sigma factor antagonist n=1 Tax=Lentzea xinjiangensis TaxID=402600 RepID=A0A1H9UGP3_9PSEU|nr:STAS domain-containing protein [Lentzea xinjiangensis]SES08605.1 anti-anti-sigma factor [Lentzea xinjiangensis]